MIESRAPPPRPQERIDHCPLAARASPLLTRLLGGFQSDDLVEPRFHFITVSAPSAATATNSSGTGASFFFRAAGACAPRVARAVASKVPTRRSYASGTAVNWIHAFCG